MGFSLGFWGLGLSAANNASWLLGLGSFEVEASGSVRIGLGGVYRMAPTLI